MSQSRIVEGPGFKIRFDDEPGYLRAYVHDGVDSLDVSMAMWMLLGQECQQRGVTRLLVLEDLESTVAMEDIATVVQAHVQAGMQRVRTAFVELRDDVQGSELAQIISNEHGIDNRVFTDEGEARRWLLYGA